MRCLLVIPAFHESARLPAYLHELLPALDAARLDCEVLIVDDGSSAEEAGYLCDLAERLRPAHPRLLPPFCLDANRGKGGAVKAGLVASRADFRFLCDADLSMPPAELPRFLPPVLQGFDIAIASREGRIIDAVLDRRTLLAVSTDLSHYLEYETARSRDRGTAETIERLEFNRLGPYDACGYAALNGALCAARNRGWRIERLDLRNSGDTSGDPSRVVGYGAWAFAA